MRMVRPQKNGIKPIEEGPKRGQGSGVIPTRKSLEIHLIIVNIIGQRVLVRNRIKRIYLTMESAKFKTESVFSI